MTHMTEPVASKSIVAFDHDDPGLAYPRVGHWSVALLQES